MTGFQFFVLIFFLVFPAAYQRCKFAWKRKSFDDIKLREKTGLNIHHGTYGILLAFIGTMMLVFGWRNFFSIGLAASGWGLMLDEIIPLVMMPNPGRELELDVYARSRNATIVMISIIVLIAFFIYCVL